MLSNYLDIRRRKGFVVQILIRADQGPNRWPSLSLYPRPDLWIVLDQTCCICPSLSVLIGPTWLEPGWTGLSRPKLDRADRHNMNHYNSIRPGLTWTFTWPRWPDCFDPTLASKLSRATFLSWYASRCWTACVPGVVSRVLDLTHLHRRRLRWFLMFVFHATFSYFNLH